MPALLTRISSFPNRSTVAAIALRQDSSLATSRWTKIASPPDLQISRATSRPNSSRKSPRTTFAPSWAKIRPSAAPIPRAPPLINATLSFSLIA